MTTKIINYFVSPTHKLYELKYTDVPNTAPKNEQYKWIYESLDGMESITLVMKEYLTFPCYKLRIFESGIFVELTCMETGFFNGDQFKNEYYKKTQ